MFVYSVPKKSRKVKHLQKEITKLACLADGLLFIMAVAALNVPAIVLSVLAGNALLGVYFKVTAHV